MILFQMAQEVTTSAYSTTEFLMILFIGFIFMLIVLFFGWMITISFHGEWSKKDPSES